MKQLKKILSDICLHGLSKQSIYMYCVLYCYIVFFLYSTDGTEINGERQVSISGSPECVE